MRAALLGTGLMGSRMAVNICKAGHDLSVWTRSMAKAEPLAEYGAAVANTAGAAVTGAELVISMLSDGPTVGALIEEVKGDLSPGAIWVDMSSTKPDEARAQRVALGAVNVRHLDAPVSGGTKGAEAASLAIMAGGDADVFEKAKPLLAAMGRPVHVGPSGSGQLSKLCNQTIVAVTISAVAEAMFLAEEGGADPAALREALKGGFADSVILQQHGERMSTRNFDPGGLSKLQLKDLDNVLAEAGGLNLELPVAQHTRDRFAHLVHNMDGADTDHSAVFLELLARNGK